MKGHNKILIDLVYLNSEGGKLIFFELLETLKAQNIIDNFYFLIDKRLSDDKKIIIPKGNYQFIKAKEVLRKNFYKKNHKKFKSYVCMSNIPPPIIINKPVHVYFHNDLFLAPFSTNLNWKNKLINYLKKIYIKYRNKKNYNWYVQSELMRVKLVNFLNVKYSNIKITPIFRNNKSEITPKKLNSFIYVSNGSKHKNHSRLLSAFIKASEISRLQIILNLTLSDTDYKKSSYSKSKIPENLKIINHGIVDSNMLDIIYQDSKFLIFPSLNESFGLPLIESINNNCKVIASDLKFIKEIIEPSLLFNPFSISSITNNILEAISKNDLNESRIIIENKSDTFVKYITNHV